MKNTKNILSIIILSMFILATSGCSRTSAGSKTADGALKSFNAIVKAYPKNKGFHRTLQHWGFSLPGNDKFEWTKDTSANKIDYAMIIQADQLMKSGLDPKKLDQKDFIFKPAAEEEGVQLSNRIVHPYNVSDKKEFSSGSEDAFRRLLKQDSSIVKYNDSEKNYVLTLGKGYEVRWAEKTGVTGDNMEFLIPAEPLIKAGLDINKLSDTGWKFESDTNQLVKTFNLK